MNNGIFESRLEIFLNLRTIVTINHKIKDGLQYSLRTLKIKRNNNSYLAKSSEGIKLTCHFSGLDCTLTITDIPISFDIEFTFTDSYLKSFSPDFDLGQFPDHLQHDICCNTQMILHDILNTKFEGAYKNMFLESKALALLLCFQKCSVVQQLDCSSCKFLTNPIEKEKMIRAKEIILNSLDNPPTIPELALQLGTNQCYLKKGFKETFGSTIYDFVQEQRMLKAKLLLITTDYSVSQVADEVGFTYVSSFSKAFKKKHGFNPSELNAIIKKE